MVNIFKSIEEGPRGPAFIPSCELAYRFMKMERANAEDEVKKFLDKAPYFDNKGKFVGLNEVIKNGFNWHMIDFLYEKGAIHYLISHNDILNEPDDEFFMALKLRYKRLIDNGMNEKDAQEECKHELKYAKDVILKACEEDREGLGKLGYEITNKGNHGIHHYLIKKPIGEYSLKLIVKEFKN